MNSLGKEEFDIAKRIQNSFMFDQLTFQLRITAQVNSTIFFVI